jgi:hypothetical protein
MWHLMPSNNDLLSIAHQTIRADSRSYVIELHLVVTSVPTSSSTLHSNTRYVRGIRSLGSVVHGGQNHVERSGILSNGRKGRASTNQAHYQGQGQDPHKHFEPTTSIPHPLSQRGIWVKSHARSPQKLFRSGKWVSLARCTCPPLAISHSSTSGSVRI